MELNPFELIKALFSRMPGGEGSAASITPSVPSPGMDSTGKMLSVGSALGDLGNAIWKAGNPGAPDPGLNTFQNKALQAYNLSKVMQKTGQTPAQGTSVGNTTPIPTPNSGVSTGMTPVNPGAPIAQQPAGADLGALANQVLDPASGAKTLKVEGQNGTPGYTLTGTTPADFQPNGKALGDLAGGQLAASSNPLLGLRRLQPTW